MSEPDIAKMGLLHASLDNATKRVRLSTDTRYPPAHGRAGKRGRIC